MIRRLALPLSIAVTGVLSLSGCSTAGSAADSASSVRPAGASASAASTMTAASTNRWSGAAVTTAPMSAADLAELQTFADGVISSAGGQVPGIWVGIWHPDKGWGIVAAGDATLDSVPATAMDHLRIGSVTKTFTATEVLKLVDAGTLALTDTIEKLLPDTAAKYPVVADVTLADLLGMTSGIPDYTEVRGMMESAYSDPEKVWTADELIDTALAGVSALGTEDKYSNTNYILLGKILEAKTGTTVQDLVNAEVAAVGMTDSALPVPGDNAMPAPGSTGYNFDLGVASLKDVGVQATPGSATKDSVSSWGQAAGGMYSTIADLGRWAATGFGTTMLSPDLAEKRLTPHDINGGALHYGLGIQNWGDGWIGHGGQAIGWESTVAYNTNTGAVIVIVVNETGSAMLGGSIVQKYFPEAVARLYL
jgi:D-alanyl-D-alanine carboxypeptidase